VIRDGALGNIALFFLQLIFHWQVIYHSWCFIM
jgi:hypothetical protein